MYVCNCNGIRETDLRAAARTVEGEAEDVYLALGHRPQCRMCLEDAAGIVEDARRAHKQLHFI